MFGRGECKSYFFVRQMVKMPKCKASEPILFDLVHYIHQQEGFGGCKHTMLLMIATNHDMTAVNLPSFSKEITKLTMFGGSVGRFASD